GASRLTRTVRGAGVSGVFTLPSGRGGASNDPPFSHGRQPHMPWTRFSKRKEVPGGLWIKCESCGSMLFRKEFDAKLRVCTACGYHFTYPARERIDLTVDPGSFVELFADLRSED